MISLEKCRKLLDPKNEKYTDQQLLAMRDLLFRLAKMNVEIFLDHQYRQGNRKE